MGMGTFPLVTVIIPVLNEERDIAGCIEALAGQDYPLGRIEVIVVDGSSVDNTVSAVLTTAAECHISPVRVLANPRARTSSSLNIGLQNASGSIVARVDARSRLQPGYLTTTVRVLQRRPEVGVVGGSQLAMPRTEKPLDIGIARALRNRWTTGLSRHRRSRVSGPADTVWMGVFRASQLRGLGGWPEHIAINEDYELNGRFRAAGFVVWFESALQSGYLPRRDLNGIARQYFYFGRAKGTLWARGMRIAARHWILLFAPIIIACMGGVTIKRFGVEVSTLTLTAVLLCIDAIGSDGRAGLVVRLWSVTTMLTCGMAWWFGTVIGYVGEQLGVRHAHSE
jgi:succinoglycan biosynthesis protein ExoA